MKYLILISAFVCVCYGQNNTGAIHLPSGPELARLVNGSFQNLDTDHDGFVERFEFESFIIVADDNNDGCMSKDEYKKFSAGTPEIASKIYEYFDADNSNCITVDKVAAQFGLMDADHNKKVSIGEFEGYYRSLLQKILAGGNPVG